MDWVINLIWLRTPSSRLLFYCLLLQQDSSISKGALCYIVAIRCVWLFYFKFIKLNKTKNSFLSYTTHISSTQQLHVAMATRPDHKDTEHYHRHTTPTALGDEKARDFLGV